MRIGLSNKITDVSFLTAAATARRRYALTLTMSDTIGKLNDDGRYYSIEFPYDFMEWSGSPTNPAVKPDIVVDPFADYRGGNTDVYWSGTRWRAAPILEYLDVTIEVGANKVVGANTSFFGIQPSPAFKIHASSAKIANSWASTFEYNASLNLVVNFANYGNTGGAGGAGGDGKVIAPKFAANGVGGGGGGGIGIHFETGRVAGDDQNGSGGAERTPPNTTAQDGTHGYEFVKGVGGTGSGDEDPVPAVVNAENGAIGGDIIHWYSPLTYEYGVAKGVADPAAHGGTLNIINKQGGFMYAGSGGGGGGGADSTSFGGTGGNGGGFVSPIYPAAQKGSAGTLSGAGAGGNAGVVVNKSFLGAGHGGKVTYTNEHTSGNTWVTMIGGERVY